MGNRTIAENRIKKKISSIGSVHLRRVSSNEHTELASSCSSNQLLSVDVLVLEEGWSFNLIHIAVSGLTLYVETPAIRLTVFGDSKGVITRGGCEDNLLLDIGEGSWNRQDTGTSMLIVHEFIRWHVRQRDTKSLVIHATPGKALSVFGDSHTVVLSTADRDNLAVLAERLDFRRVEDDGIAFSSAHRDGRLTEVIRTPSVHPAVLANSKGVVGTRSDAHDIRRKRALSRDETLELAMQTSRDSPTKLVLFLTTPGQNSALRRQRQDVLRARRKVCHFLKTGNQDWLSLNLRLGRKPNHTVASLFDVRSK